MFVVIKIYIHIDIYIYIKYWGFYKPKYICRINQNKGKQYKYIFVLNTQSHPHIRCKNQ